ncbi:hypothetical protein [Holdemania massiliensis]|uniref:hypothetical protein n=1 Tax=Holdemania massiliensis TaxID=1468449 RepID=UPI001F06E983|nr:hypothetical protein [Holdemania massiliensis]MCH1939775.1 hypothetical protein [Holdemania massiliensis]
MKKILTLVLACLMIAGCSSAPKKQTTSCSYTQEGFMTATYNLTAEENQITVMSMKMTYDKAMFGNMDFSALSEEEKTQMTDAILAQSGFSAEIKGIKTTVDIQDTISATIEIDLKEVDPTMLSNLGIDLSNAEMKMDTIVQQMKDQGFQCK